MKKYSKIITLILVSVFVILFSVSCNNYTKKYTITYKNGEETVSVCTEFEGATHHVLDPIDEVKDGDFCSGWAKDGRKYEQIVVKENIELEPFFEPMCYYTKSSDGSYYSLTSINDNFKNKLVSSFYDNLDENSAYRGITNHLIFDYYCGLEVREIADSVFRGIEIDNIKLPETIKKIGAHAFDGAKLKSIDLSGVESIGDSAFSGCEFDELVIPSSVIELGSGFSNSKIKNLIIEANIETIPSNCFRNCNIENITFSDTIEKIGDSAFENNILTNLVLPKNLKEIGDSAFENCNIENIVFNDKLEKIDDSAFADISANEIILPDSLKTIGSSIFKGGKVLKLVLGKGLEKADESLFYGMKYLIDVYNLSSISNLKFNSDVDVDVHNSLDEGVSFIDYNGYIFKNNVLVCYIGKEKYLKMPQIDEINNPLINNYKLGKGLFNDDDNIVKVTIPGFVEEIPSGVFYSCDSLQEVVLEEGITKMLSSFENCNSVKVELPETIEYVYYTYGRVGYNVNNFTDGLYLGNKNNPYLVLLQSGVKNPVVNNKTKVIASDAFKYTDSREIVISDSVTHISSYAFSSCRNLIKITLGKNVVFMGDEMNMLKLTEIYNLSNMDIKIGKDAIIHKSLDEESCILKYYDYTFKKYNDEYYLLDYQGHNMVLKLPMSFSCGDEKIDTYHIAPNAFRLTDIKMVEMPNGISSIGEYAFSGCDYLTTVSIPNSVTKIENHAFYDCESLNSINLSKGITEIETSVFADDISLNEIVIPEGVTSIGDNAFYNCSKLTSITIPSSVKTIGNRTFYSCDCLTNVNLSSGIETIGSEAFSHSGLKSIKIPEGVTSIGDGAFSECHSLVEVKIPSTVTDIAENAFSGCPQVKIIKYSGKSEE